MQIRADKFIGFFLAALLFAVSFAPMPAGAEAQMRCAGASPYSPPCTRVELSAPGLTGGPVSRAPMACCRAGKSECAAMPVCPVPHSLRRPAASRPTAFPHRAALAPPKCLICVCAAGSAPASPALPRFRWLLAASPALAPPAAAAAILVPCILPVRSRTGTAPLSPRFAPTLHGLRAPPA